MMFGTKEQKLKKYVLDKYKEKPLIEFVDNCKFFKYNPLEFEVYSDGITEASLESNGNERRSIYSGFNVIIFCYIGNDWTSEMDRLKIYIYNKTDLKFKELKQLISMYLNTYMETYS